MTGAASGWLGSRRRVALTTIVVLALLDLGRSVFARLGYAGPVETWQPDPKAYVDLAWPPGADVPAAAPEGQRIYLRRCAVCHGPDGRGNGPAAPSLIPRPRDFTRGEFKYRSTAPDQPPSEADLVRTVRDGLRASAMPYFRDILTESEIRTVVAYAEGLMAPLRPVPGPGIAIPPRIAADAASLARGAQLYLTKGCNACHGQEGRGGVTLADAKGYPVISRDLTAPWTFRGGAEPEQLWLRLTTGLAPGPMPSFAATTTPQERWDLVNYVLSLARTPPWQPGGRLEGPGQQADLTRRGEYLVHAEMCGLCHTMINRTGIYRADDFYLAGGMLVGAYPYGVIVSRNLTSDSATGLGRWTEAQIVAALRDGRARGRVLNMYDMPWLFLHRLSDDDATAIARYLKVLPPVSNRIPEPLHYGVIETILNKLTRKLPAVPTTSLTFADQRFGQPSGPPRERPQTWLINAQWLVLLLGALAFGFAAPAGRRLPAGGREWLRTITALLGLGLAGLLGAAIYRLPLLTVIPPDQIAGGALAAIREPDSAVLRSPEQATLARRGRYLFTIASCVLCHGPDGSGGLKVSWKPMGTLWTRNLTPDPETGLARWSDAEIARAIRSGISRDGYQLHWQGMIWDHSSNWDEEDLQALIAYLRALPPVRHRIPPDRPPAPDDCEVYTFWTSESHMPGCR
jgi:mono/diheme cytochrome c family protein